ncbi:nucleotide pyrophosphohydrolase [Demequina sp. SO4-13]|uniref:nucleotide pyrophosphohydrolase n=1 Tax=Demequina sp. SO4-13 TaxID=3401027 RepID=UPI003AF84920
MTQSDSLRGLTREIRDFAQERDWEQFHDPKSLVLALVGEVGELAELFQWVPADDAVQQFADEPKKQRAADEIADVATYLLRLADVLSIDIEEAIVSKMAESQTRFDPAEVRGVAPDKL